MLERLTIHNLAILSNVDAHFHDGFTVLTGETGAGKSLVIDSLSLLLGARASTELIRAGEDKASIQGIFTSSPRIEAFLVLYALRDFFISRLRSILQYNLNTHERSASYEKKRENHSSL